MKYEEALRTYESSSGKAFPEDLVMATVVTGLKEPLRSQIQLRMGRTTTYADVREWILQYESLNAPWSSSLSGKGTGLSSQSDMPQPMEVDQVKGGRFWKGDHKGKGKEKSKGKVKNKMKDKGKYTKGKSKDSQYLARPWSGNGKGWSTSWTTRSWKGLGEKGKGGNQDNGGVCHLCGQSGHWKNECPKGKGKNVNQVESSQGPHQQQQQATPPPSSSGSTSYTSASAYRTSSTVNRVELFDMNTSHVCRETVVFDISEVDEGDSFSLAGPEVLMIQGVDLSGEGEVLPMNAIPVYALDATDGDGKWTLPQYDLEAEYHLFDENLKACSNVLAIHTKKKIENIEVVVDSGADVSVAPLRFRKLGTPAEKSNVMMQDAQGKQIPEVESRILDIDVSDVEGNKATIREKFAIAQVGSLILSLGRLVRWGWQLGRNANGPLIERGSCQLPIKLRRNTLIMLAGISTIAAASIGAVGTCDRGPPLPEVEDLAATQGWHILPSGLPILVSHRSTEVRLDESMWSSEDWRWIAVFVRLEPSLPHPQPGDVWVQVSSMSTTDFENAPKAITDMESELEGHHDIIIFLHVDELPHNLLSSPGDVFKEPADVGGYWASSCSSGGCGPSMW